ncbi:MAG TPA: MaoC family dehydratase N-terminal domain-containing protein [Acidimicrobiales bacterium]|jgi:acyl dehydratase|nr:MaoC family dehydratase N-terminal domain-containing protein [Acidimicrobiales bacterium]
MAVDTSLIGQVSGRKVVVIERGPVSAFALAVKDQSRVYRDRQAAVDAGFRDIPAPPTFPFAMGFWGTFRELQQDLEPVGSNPMWEIMGQLGAGLILHGEQEFEYHRPVVVGDVLYGEDVLSDAYEKEADNRVMTFIVTTTTWRDYATGEPGDPVVTTRFNLIHRAHKRRSPSA